MSDFIKKILKEASGLKMNQNIFNNVPRKKTTEAKIKYLNLLKKKLLYHRADAKDYKSIKQNGLNKEENYFDFNKPIDNQAYHSDKDAIEVIVNPNSFMNRIYPDPECFLLSHTFIRKKNSGGNLFAELKNNGYNLENLFYWWLVDENNDAATWVIIINPIKPEEIKKIIQKKINNDVLWDFDNAIINLKKFKYWENNPVVWGAIDAVCFNFNKPLQFNKNLSKENKEYYDRGYNSCLNNLKNNKKNLL